ncbi:MAG: hypothetical protein IT437_09600 [Phycisphaerales bacterium]|nr:hypothetical protein [Phycisphaerales bacterium]
MGRGTKVLIALCAVALIGAAAGYVAGRLFGVWNKVDDWIGRQVVDAVSTYIVPTVAFKDLTYNPPYSVGLRGVTLASPDGTEVVSIRQVDLTLGEVPRTGRPIVLRSVTLHEPTLRLIREKPGEGVRFRGLVPFVKPGVNDQSRVREEFRLSRILRLNAVTIDNGSVSYEPGDGRPQMRLGGLSLSLNVSGSDGSGAWHTLNLQAGRLPDLRIDLAGRLNTDTLDAEVSRARFDMVMDPDRLSSLPPSLREAITPYDPRGRVTLDASGTIPALRLGRASLRGTLGVVGFRVNLGDYCIPIDTLTADGRLADGAMMIGKLDARLLSGAFNAAAQPAPSDGSRAVTFNWSAYGLDLNQLARTKARDGEDPTLAGTLNASGQVTAEPGNIPESVGGAGVASVRQGSLVRVPLFSRLANLLRGRGGAGHDSLDAEFHLTDRGVLIDKALVLLSFSAARVKGLVAYDGALQLEMNAGPLERLQAALGEVGNVLGAVTDRVVTYRVSGTLANPKISVAPLGFAARGRREAPPGG